MLAVIRSKRRRRRASGVVAKRILPASELSAAFSRAFSSASASISIALTSRDAHQAHRNREHARARADVQRVLEALRRAKFLDRRERAVSGRMMPGAKGLSGIDHQLKPPRSDVRVPRRNDQQAAAHPQRLETIHPCRGPSGIRDELASAASGRGARASRPPPSHAESPRAATGQADRNTPGVPASRGDARSDGRRRPRIPSPPRRPACAAASSTIAAGISKATRTYLRAACVAIRVIVRCRSSVIFKHKGHRAA